MQNINKTRKFCKEVRTFEYTPKSHDLKKFGLCKISKIIKFYYGDIVLFNVKNLQNVLFFRKEVLLLKYSFFFLDFCLNYFKFFLALHFSFLYLSL
jgi:hypothetical protein